MIYDKIDNWGFYAAISEDIRVGFEYLREVKPDIAVGSYQINPRVKAIVSEYETKVQNEYGYEAHRKNIDIQYLIYGSERIACLPIGKLQETKPYSEEKDAAFYDETNIQPQELLLGNGYFAIFFPQDGHMPQLCDEDMANVKKVVVKVRIVE